MTRRRAHLSHPRPGVLLMLDLLMLAILAVLVAMSFLYVSGLDKL
jgi:hypothetical protein